jgi:hypothetical protein
MSKTKMSVINDPAAYRKRCEPRDLEVVEESMAAFYLGLRELITVHGIADVMLVMQISVRIKPSLLEPDEERETFVSACLHFGDQAHALELAAYGHAYHRAELEARLNGIKAGAEKRARGE